MGRYRWVGIDPSTIDASPRGIRDDCTVLLTGAQARIVWRAGGTIRYSTNNLDRGGPGRLPKRWAEWYASIADVASCPDATPNMRDRAGLPPETREARRARLAALLLTAPDSKETSR